MQHLECTKEAKMTHSLHASYKKVEKGKASFHHLPHP